MFKIVLLVSLYLAVADMASPRVRVVPVIATKKLPDTLVYEGSVPMDIVVVIPDFVHSEFVQHCQNDDINCFLKNSIFFMYQDFEEELSSMKNDSSTRNPRQVLYAAAAAAGYLLRPAVNRITTSLFGDDDDLSQQINSMHEDIRNVMKKSEGYSTKMKNILEEAKRQILGNSRAIDSIDTKISKALHNIYDLISATSLNSQFRQGISDCLLQRFPATIIPLGKLKKHLEDLNQALTKKGFQVAISSSRLSTYAKLPLSDCFLEGSTMHIVVNVPVVSLGANRLLQEIVHKKFAFNGQTCEIYPNEAMLVATDERKQKFVMITKNLLHHCSPFDIKMCLVPRFARDSSENINCVLSLMKGHAIEHLKPHCGFRCHDDNDLEITQVDGSTLVITNARNITMYCAGQRHHYSIPKVGALEIRLSCSCNTYINGIQLQQPMTCINTDYSVEENMHLSIPNLWSKFDHMLQGTVSEHAGHEGVIDEEWMKNVPVLNFTKRVNNNEQKSSVSLTMGVGTVVLLKIIILVMCVFIWKLWKQIDDLKEKTDATKTTRRNVRK